jgi:predicted aldo/keto reductase-like oxidoreductase
MIEKRILGKTGLEISAVSLGGVAFTWLDKQRSEKLVNYCLDNGINYLDVYAGTGNKIGNILRKRRSQFFLSTRGTLKTIDGCLKNLKVDYFDIFLISMVDSARQYQDALEEAQLLEKARKLGKFRFLGICTHNPSLYARIIKDRTFPAIMLPCNCVDEINRQIFDGAERAGIGIIAMKPFAGGNLTNHRASLKYVLNTKVATALIGMTNAKEVKENLAILAGAKTITEQDRKYYEKIRKKLGKTFCRYCGHCIFPKPCPAGIPIRTIMMLETLAYQANLRRTVSDETLSTVKNCKHCGQCEKRCPYHLPIRKLLPQKVATYLRMTER